MKELVFEGTTLHYERISIDSELGDSIVTNFYLGEETFTRRKYIIFGEKITETKPKLVFRLWFDVESENWTKEEVRKKIAREMALLNRKDEIARGEII
jgi:hypothetical protein